MIKPKTFERALRDWAPWINAIKQAHQDGESMTDNPEAWWSYSKAVLRRLRFPAKLMMCLYFLSCVFSSNKKGFYYFKDIKLPPLSYGKYNEFTERLRRTMWTTMVFEFGAIRPTKQWPDFKVIGDRPTPPAVWHESDVQFVAEWESHHTLPPYSIADSIRTFYSPCFIILAPDHPILAIGSNMKRETNEELALLCAQMKEQGYSHKQIGEKFGWALQEDSYGNLTRCSTARRYVKRGRALSEA